MPEKSFPHLIPAVREIATQSAQSRALHLYRERWVSYELAEDALKQMLRLLELPPSSRPACALLVGPTNNGKSSLLHRLVNSQPRTRSPTGVIAPIVFVEMPSSPTIERFYRGLLSSLDAPSPSTWARTGALETLCIDLLREIGIKLLVIDEFHNILSGRRNAQLEFLNLLRFLTNRLQLSMVLGGTEQAAHAIRTDAQLENRFKPIVLHRWTTSEESMRLVQGLISSFPLQRPSPLSEAAITYILRRSEGTIGEVIDLLRTTAEVAIRTGEECINRKTLELSSYLGPSGRRAKLAKV
ncbi:TniB family NTP-binding protein [Xanthomonas citri]|uniref:TniB family NTP-binding protein n=1 Tax=Xanthomonas citri TaxID=346 RepID=UPI000C4EEB88|nr:TniB family NTP-binding protein [Xanthomonas citri]SOO14219.1 TniB family protein [Xanthomonas citri pv. fuscans]